MIAKVFACLIMTMLSIQSATAGIDAMSLTMQQPYLNKNPLHWDNRITPKLWSAGVEPEYDSTWELYKVHLKPGQSSSFKLAAYETLRLYQPKSEINKTNYKISISNGTGLLKQYALPNVDNSHSIFISPASSQTEIITIKHSEQTAMAIEFAVFVSRREALKQIAPYRDLAWLTGTRVGMSHKPLQLPEIYWQLQAHKPQWVDIEGPVRVTIKNRLHYETLASALIQNYRIRYQLNNNPARWLDFSTSVESRKKLFINTMKKVLGREQQAYIEIPAGQHRLQLVSDRNLFMQVLKQNREDYLLPQFNEPPLSVKKVYDQDLMSQQPLAITHALVESAMRNNMGQSSAIAGSMILKQAALKRPDYPKGLATANKMLGQNSYYRTLLPSIKQTSLSPFTAYFLNKQLTKIENPLPDPQIFEQHQAAANKRLDSATFSPVLSGAKADIYLLPTQKSASVLRIITDKRDCIAREFKLQVNQQAAKTFNIRCLPAIKNNSFVQSITETALLKKQKQSLTGSAKNTTLSYFYSADNQAAPIIPVAINQIMLPPKVKQIKVWSEDGKTQALNLALQIRTAKSLQFSEQSYLAHLHNIPQAELFELFISDSVPANDQNSHSKQQLQNQWVPLKRYLKTLHRNYKHSVSNPIAKEETTQSTAINLSKKLALQAEKNQQWTTAIKHWSHISYASNGLLRDQAMLAQAENLIQLSENFLAQSIWRYLTLNGHKQVAQQARKHLLNVYAEHSNDQAILRLNAAMFLKQPDQANLQSLIRSLMQNKHYRYALILSDLAQQQPTEQMLKAAYQLRWWQTYQRLVSQLPLSRQRYWQGMKAQYQGNYQTALDAWNQPALQQWKNQLQSGLNLKNQLSSQTEENTADNHADQLLYKQWQDWENNQIGDYSWQNANQLILDAAGVDRYYSIERNLHSHMYRARSNRPVKLELIGPATLNFKVRVLHQQVNTPINGWLKIKDNQTLLRYPFFNNKSVQGLSLTGDGQLLPGNWVTLEYQVGQGLHQIELSSIEAPVSVSIEQLQNEAPLSVLPDLNVESYLYLDKTRHITKQQIKQSVEVLPSSSLAIPEQVATTKELLELKPASITDEQQAIKKMMQALAIMENKSSLAVIVFADKIQALYPDSKVIKQIWNRISGYSGWKSVRLIKSSAGMRFIKMQRGEISSPTMAIRKALISPSKQGEHLIFGHKRLLMMMSNLSTKKLTAEIKLDDMFFFPDSPSQINYQIDQASPKKLNLSRGSDWKKIKLSIPSGHHQIRFWIANPVSNQFVKIRFPGQNLEVNIVEERSFFVSTPANPLKFYVKGPNKIRIDDWSKGKIISRYQYVKADWQQLALPPFKNEQLRILQIKQLETVDQPTPVAPRYIQRNLIAVAEPTLKMPAHTTAKVEKVKDYYHKTNQSCCTWSVGTQIQRRNNLQEDTSRGTPEIFQQFNLDHRYYDQFTRNYWHTRIFSRLRDNGNPSFGVKESLSLNPSALPFTVNLEAKAVTQAIDGDQEWLGQFNLELMQKANLTPKTTLTQQLAWFGRYMSLRDSDKVNKDGGFIDDTLTQDVDQDIYTAYKAQHMMGLNSSIYLSHTPWLDTRWKLRFDSASNENLNIFKPDHLSMQAHWKQLFGSLSLDASYRIRFYLEDQDRSTASTRQTARFRFNWQSWTYKRNRLEIGGQYNYDIDKNAHLGMISLTYHFSGERGYRDFKPNAIDFRNIRKRQWLDELH